MVNRRRGAFLWLCIAGLILAGAGWESIPVKEIKIQGNRKIEKEAILYKLQTKVGEPFSKQKIEEDIRAVYNIGYFEDIKVDVNEIDGGLSVTYIVTERPLIKKITFLGNKKIQTESLQEKIDIRTGNIYNPSLIERNIQNLIQYYNDEGYYLAEITSRTETLSKEWIELIFDIQEGQKVKIRKVIIEGNTAYPDEQIRKLLKTKKHGCFSFFTSSGYLKKDVLSQDVLRIEDYYYNNGFIHAVVQEPRVFFDSEKQGLVITFPIAEGEQFFTGNIRIRGNEILSNQDIQEHLTIQEAKVFDRSQLRRDISTIQDLYAEKGYVFTRVVPLTHEVSEDRKMNITMDIEEGGLTYIDRIRISGNVKTRDKVIRREVKLLEGDIFNSREIRKSYNNINNLGFFEEVNLDIQPEPEKNKVDLVVKVKERMTGQMSIGGGYSSQDQFVGTADIKMGNLFGLGQKLSVSAELASSRSTYDIGFTEPWLFDIPLSAGFDLYYVDKEYDSFTKTAKGGNIQLGYPVADYTRLYCTYLYENVNLTADDPATVSRTIFEALGQSRTSSMRWSLVRDSRDNRIKPSSGSMNKLSFQFAGGFLGGTNYFTKTTFDTGWHFPVWKKLVLSLHGKLGYASGYAGRQLPPFERFYAGGLYTVRGYEERSIGPKTNGDPDGGNKLVVTNVEFQFPIYDIIRGVLFWDAGNVFLEDKEFFDQQLRMGAGVGVRFFTPIGPLRLDWGHKLKRRSGEKASVWHFAIGTYF